MTNVKSSPSLQQVSGPCVYYSKSRKLYKTAFLHSCLSDCRPPLSFLSSVLCHQDSMKHNFVNSSLLRNFTTVKLCVYIHTIYSTVLLGAFKWNCRNNSIMTYSILYKSLVALVTGNNLLLFREIILLRRWEYATLFLNLWEFFPQE